MSDDWTIETLFETSPDPGRAVFEGHEIVRSDKFPTEGSAALRIVVEGVNSDWPQAIYLKSDLPVEINGHRGQAFVLWKDTAPREILVQCDSATESLWVSNAWDPDGSGYPERWLGCGAMMPEEIERARRYRCNDGYPDTDFDDLVFRVEREPG